MSHPRYSRAPRASLGTLAAILAAGSLLVVSSRASASLKFIVAGDPQIGFSDPVAEQQRFIALAHISNVRAVDFVLLEGDMTHHDSRGEWRLFDQALTEFHVPVYAARGNHDGLTNWQARFGPTYYSTTFSDLALVVLDSNIMGIPTSDPTQYQQQWDWLRTTLPQIAQTNPQHIMVLTHAPPFTYQEGEDNTPLNWQLPTERTDLLSLARLYGVDTFLSGHIHSNKVATPTDQAFTIYTTTGTSLGKNNGDPTLAYRLFQIDDNGLVTQQLIYDLTDPAGGDPHGLLLGDVNEDGYVNALDISAFVEAVTFPIPYNPLADMNQDEQVNALDVAGFISAVTSGGGSSPLVIPEPAAWLIVDAGTLLFLRRAQQRA